jgi:hypothetical protein
MTIKPLALGAYGAIWTHKITVKAADISAAATSKTLAIFPASGSLPAGTCILAVAYSLITPFTGGAVSAMTMKIGDGLDDDRYLTAAKSDLFSATAKPYVVGNETTSPWVPVSTTATENVINAIFTATGANTSVLTAGEVEIYLQLSDFAELVKV